VVTPTPAAAPLLLLAELGFPRIDPVALDLPGPVDVRWYGLAYVAGFFLGHRVLARLARAGYLPLKPQDAGDLVVHLVLGVILGGRLGFILFYDFARMAAEPSRILRIWEGGLAFHGGLIGAVVACALFARRHGIPFLRLGDALALAVPFGLLFGRIANFVNGELYGRVTGPEVPWAMRFPTDPAALRLLGADTATSLRGRELALREAFASGRWDAVREQVPLRHPSQLYEAALEGVVLALLLWAVYAWFRRRGLAPGNGLLGGLFLVLYGLFRSFVELFRQPDAQFRDAGDALGTVLGPLTMGQTLSLAMIAGGIALAAAAWRRRPTPLASRDDASADDGSAAGAAT
jgi:phosphatidylglycerol:prolipoprotein diacylglycerol transferase